MPARAQRDTATHEPTGQAGSRTAAMNLYTTRAAQSCAKACGSQGCLEPVLMDRRSNCHLLRPQR